jgi:hypothetical protein
MRPVHTRRRKLLRRHGFVEKGHVPRTSRKALRAPVAQDNTKCFPIALPEARQSAACGLSVIDWVTMQVRGALDALPETDAPSLMRMTERRL